MRPLVRVEFDAARLIAEHPPCLRDPGKRAVFSVASAPEHPFAGAVVYARWEVVEPPGELPAPRRVEVRAGFYDYAPSAGDGVVDWHVNFADPELFVAYGGPLMAQDELQVAEHPVLASVREALRAQGSEAVTREADGRPAPVTVTGVQRRCAVHTLADAAAGHPRDLYGNGFVRASTAEVRAATEALSPPPLSHILAMAAPGGGRGPYARHELLDVLRTAHTGFAAARQEAARLAGSRARAVVHTGFWGCGAFGGNRTVMTVLQVLAADLAGVGLVFHSGPDPGRDVAAGALGEYAALREGTSALAEVLDRLERRGFRWGVSNGT